MDIEIQFGFQSIQFEHRSEAAKDKGKKLVNAGHVLKVIERKNGQNISFIRGNVIRQTKVNAEPYVVELEVNGQRNVIGATCNCIAGVGGFCKHISALVIYINSEFAQSKTSAPNEWVGSIVNTKRAGQDKYKKGKLLEDLFPPPPPKRYCIIASSSLSVEQKAAIPPSTAVQAMLLVEDEVKEITQNELEVIDRDNKELEELVSFILNKQKIEEIMGTEVPKFNRDCCKTTFVDWVDCNALQICLKTVNNKEYWHSERKKRITASRCYELFTYCQNKNANWEKKMKNYIMRKPFSNEAVRHGISCEKDARQKYQDFYKTEVAELGLVILQSRPWLAASPDGVVLENGVPIKVLEIKCPVRGQSSPVEDVLGNCPYLKMEKDGCINLKKKHAYYAQVQVNLMCLGLKKCDFMIYCSFDQSFKIINVPLDFEFCKNLLEKLTFVFYEKMLHFFCILKSQ